MIDDRNNRRVANNTRRRKRGWFDFSSRSAYFIADFEHGTIVSISFFFLEYRVPWRIDFFHSNSLELPSLSLSLIGDGRLVVRIIVKIMIRVGRAGNRCRARIGYTRVRASLGPPTRYMYIRPLSTPLDLDLALDLDNWPSIILNDYVHGNVVSWNKRWSIDNLSLIIYDSRPFSFFFCRSTQWPCPW